MHVQGGPEKTHKVWRSTYFVPVDMLSSIIITLFGVFAYIFLWECHIDF